MPIEASGYRTLVVAGSALSAAGAVPVARELLVATREPSVALEIVSTPWFGSLPAFLIFGSTLMLVVGFRPERGITKSRITGVALIAYGATSLVAIGLGLLAASGVFVGIWAGSTLEALRILSAFLAGGLVALEAVLGGLARWSLLIVAVTHLPAQLSSFVAAPPWATQPLLWEQLNLVAILFWGITYIVDGLPQRSRAAANP